MFSYSVPDPAPYGAHDTNCTFFSSQHKSSTKMALISLARDFSTYYTLRTVGLHCNKNPIYLIPEKELYGLSHNFHIHVSVSDLYIPRIAFHIFSCSRICRPMVKIYKSLTDT